MRYTVDSYNALRIALQKIAQELSFLPEEVLFDGKLVIDELATNVLQHGGGRAHIRVECGEELLIAVRGDRAFRPPEESVCSPLDAEQGRGLFLVDALTVRREYSDEDGICVILDLSPASS